MIGKKEMKKLMDEQGIANTWLTRYNDKNKTSRKVKFRNYSLIGDQVLYETIVNQLNSLDGGGWSVKSLGRQVHYTNCTWEIVKYYQN